jgi:hypothetical protein
MVAVALDGLLSLSLMLL